MSFDSKEWNFYFSTYHIIERIFLNITYRIEKSYKSLKSVTLWKLIAEQFHQHNPYSYTILDSFANYIVYEMQICENKSAF